MKAVRHLPKQMRPFMWPKGVSGNPKGRPKGKTLKEFAKEYLLNLPEPEKLKFLAALPPEVAWKMAEGNPTDEIKGDLNVSVEVSEAIKKKHDTDSGPK